MSDSVKTYRVLGMMSGTSLDGLDLCAVNFSRKERGWSWQILDAVTWSYEGNGWKQRLEDAYRLSEMELGQVNLEYAMFLGESARQFISHSGLEIDLIASHGHTIMHRPEKGLTIQIGNHVQLANAAGIPAVGNFRQQDVRLGGQGAPLVPMGDMLLFGEYEYCLNLGGFANVSFDVSGVRKAFDISPCNMLLNEIAGHEGLAYDENGKMAASGTVIEPLLAQWNNIGFYRHHGPKSLGREWYEDNFSSIDQWLSQYSPADVMATSVEHIAQQIGKVLQKEGRALVTGGGAFNQSLIRRIKHYSRCEIVIPETALIEFKEALVFALLGVLRMENEINVLSSVTGASRDHSSGDVYLPELNALL